MLVILHATFAGNWLKALLSLSVATFIAGLVYTSGYIFTPNSKNAHIVRLLLRKTSWVLSMELDEEKQKDLDPKSKSISNIPNRPTGQDKDPRGPRLAGRAALLWADLFAPFPKIVAIFSMLMLGLLVMVILVPYFWSDYIREFLAIVIVIAYRPSIYIFIYIFFPFI